MAMPPIVEARSVCRYYGAVTALEGINFRIDPGKVVGFAGDNGAGKSTLMRIAAGDVRPSRGDLRIAGETVSGYSPRRAREIGVEMVYQDLALCDNLEIYENIFLGRELKRFRLGGFGLLDKEAMKLRADEVLSRLELNLPSLTEPVSALSGGQRQLVAIARAMALSPQLVTVFNGPAFWRGGSGPLMHHWSLHNGERMGPAVSDGIVACAHVAGAICRDAPDFAVLRAVWRTGAGSLSATTARGFSQPSPRRPPSSSGCDC